MAAGNGMIAKLSRPPSADLSPSHAEQPPSPSLLDHQIALVMTPHFADAAGGDDALALATGTLLGEVLHGDGLEEILVAQMFALHNAVMDDLAQATAQRDIETSLACRNSANKSSRTCALLAEKLMTLRGKSTEQKVTVEHVHVHAGGQAIVGNVRPGQPGGRTEQK